LTHAAVIFFRDRLLSFSATAQQTGTFYEHHLRMSKTNV